MFFIQNDGQILSNFPFLLLHAFLGIPPQCGTFENKLKFLSNSFVYGTRLHDRHFVAKEKTRNKKQHLFCSLHALIQNRSIHEA